MTEGYDLWYTVLRMNDLLEIIRNRTTETNQVTVAHELGITQATLSRLLAGKRGMGRKVLVGILRIWPELEEEVIQHLRTM